MPDLPLWLRIGLNYVNSPITKETPMTIKEQAERIASLMTEDDYFAVWVENDGEGESGFWNYDPDDEEGEDEVSNFPIMYRYRGSSVSILEILRTIPRKYDFKIKQLVDINL